MMGSRLIVTLVAGMICAGPLQAQDGEVQKLKAEIELIEKRLDSLEKKSKDNGHTSHIWMGARNIWVSGFIRAQYQFVEQERTSAGTRPCS